MFRLTTPFLFLLSAAPLTSAAADTTTKVTGVRRHLSSKSSSPKAPSASPSSAPSMSAASTVAEMVDLIYEDLGCTALSDDTAMMDIEFPACQVNGNIPLCVIPSASSFSCYCCPGDAIDVTAIEANTDFTAVGTADCDNPPQFGVYTATVDETTGTTDTETNYCATLAPADLGVTAF